MQTTVSRELWLENAMAQYETPLLRLCCALLGDAALAEVTDRGEEGLQQIAPWQNSYYCITDEGLMRQRL